MVVYYALLAFFRQRGNNMKKKNIRCLILIALCLAVFFGYRSFDALRTDTTPPEIHIGAEIPEISVYDDHSLLLSGITATDRRDGDVTGSLLVERIQLLDHDGTAKIVCAAFDSAGNVRKADREFRYTDYKSPEISLSGPLTFELNSGFDILRVVSAEDLQDGDLSHRVRATSLDGSAVTTLGTHEVELRVTNSLDDTVELVVPVEVYAPGLYNATLTLTDYLIYLDKDAHFNPQRYLKDFVRGAVRTSLTGGMPANFTLTTTGEVDTSTPGVYAVGYTVTYAANGQSNLGYSKLIVVVEG